MTFPPSKPWLLLALLAGTLPGRAEPVAASAAPGPAAAAALTDKPVPAPAGDAPATDPAPAIAVPPPAPDPVAADQASLLRIGAAKLAAGDADSARIAYRQVAEASGDPTVLPNALLGLARAYRLGGDSLKATATYERLIKDYPEQAVIPAAYLELGRALRDLGSPKLAIAAFYNVLQSVIKFPDGDTDNYRRLALTAQFEIAETHLATGNYEEAVRFFNRLNLLDLAEADRARARFKSAQARLLSGDRPAALLALQAFITECPDDPNSPEARFLLARLLSELNRREDSLQVTLDLLHHEHDRTDSGGAARWRVWQQRTGNQLANEFYSQGEFAGALLIYKALAALDAQPVWRLPVLYQIGLCNERLLQINDALDTYREISTLTGDPPGEFADLGRMAAWRIQQLTWWTKTQDDLHTLLTPPRAAVASAHP